MATWHVNGTVLVQIDIQVEADSFEDAVKDSFQQRVSLKSTDDKRGLDLPDDVNGSMVQLAAPHWENARLIHGS